MLGSYPRDDGSNPSPAICHIQMYMPFLSLLFNWVYYGGLAPIVRCEAYKGRFTHCRCGISNYTAVNLSKTDMPEAQKVSFRIGK